MVGGSTEGLEESWPLPQAMGRAEGLRRVIYRGSLGVCSQDILSWLGTEVTHKAWQTGPGHSVRRRLQASEGELHLS